MPFYRFRNGVSNCIVATDVVDEGIDIPTCTLVIRYDLPLDYRGYVQSKGRARHSSSHYKVLVPNDDDAFLQRYKDYKETESILKAVNNPKYDKSPHRAMFIWRIKKKKSFTDIKVFFFRNYKFYLFYLYGRILRAIVW